MPVWTKDRIASLTNNEIKALRENADKLGQIQVTELCNEALIARSPIRPRNAAPSEDRSGQYVSEFHFVCPNELGLTRNRDGTIWTGTWVVAEEHAERAVRYSAIVLLHSSRAESSYLQGKIRAWRKSPRQPRYSGEQLTQVEEGIDFLFEPSGSALPWKGYGTGEKGYAWMPVAK